MATSIESHSDSSTAFLRPLPNRNIAHVVSCVSGGDGDGVEHSPHAILSTFGESAFQSHTRRTFEARINLKSIPHSLAKENQTNTGRNCHNNSIRMHAIEAANPAGASTTRPSTNLEENSDGIIRPSIDCEAATPFRSICHSFDQDRAADGSVSTKQPPIKEYSCSNDNLETPPYSSRNGQQRVDSAYDVVVSKTPPLEDQLCLYEIKSPPRIRKSRQGLVFQLTHLNSMMSGLPSLPSLPCLTSSSSTLGRAYNLDMNAQVHIVGSMESTFAHHNMSPLEQHYLDGVAASGWSSKSFVENNNDDNDATAAQEELHGRSKAHNRNLNDPASKIYPTVNHRSNIWNHANFEFKVEQVVSFLEALAPNCSVAKYGTVGAGGALTPWHSMASMSTYHPQYHPHRSSHGGKDVASLPQRRHVSTTAMSSIFRG